MQLMQIVHTISTFSFLIRNSRNVHASVDGENLGKRSKTLGYGRCPTCIASTHGTAVCAV